MKYRSKNAASLSSTVCFFTAWPLVLKNLDFVERLQLATQIVKQRRLAGDRKIFIGLRLVLRDEVPFKCRIRLVTRPGHGLLRHKLGGDGALIGERNRLLAGGLEFIAHVVLSLLT